MRLNTRVVNSLRTHEGATAHPINAEQQLRRSVMSCLLWEKEFYEDGAGIAERIAELVPKVQPSVVAAIAIEAREQMHLRHVPLLLVREMARHASHRAYVRETLTRVIQRVDEFAEFLSMYWLDGKQPLAASVKKGLADAFAKFDEYQFSKYDRDNSVRLRDVMFLTHPKPGAGKADLFKRIAERTLETPDTWEVALSASGGESKREHWERLLREDKLGGLALLRNLRNMEQEDVAESLIDESLRKMNTRRILPFRFIAAAKAVPRYENYIDEAMLRALGQMPKSPGKTIVVIDVSGSMYGRSLSEKSDMDRAIAASALGAIARELCEHPAIYATAGSDRERVHKTELVPNRHGIALADAIYNLCRPLGGGGIFLKQVIEFLREREQTADRVIVITDEQDCAIDSKDSPLLAEPFGQHNYLINVASYQNGVGYGKWTHIDGFSESVFRYIQEVEKTTLQPAEPADDMAVLA